MNNLSRVQAVMLVLFMSSTRANGQDKGKGPNYVEEAVQIFNTIFHKYNSDVPPRKSYPDPLLLQVNVKLIHVADLNNQGQFMESTIDLQVKWQDSRLLWLPHVVHEITVKQDLIWTPDLAIDNAITEPSLVAHPRLVIDKQGYIYWFRRMNMKTVCPTNLDDIVYCNISIGSNLLNSQVINFEFNTSSCDVANMVSSHALEVNLGPVYLSQEEKWLRNASFPVFTCSFEVLPKQESLTEEQQLESAKSTSNECCRPLMNHLTVCLLLGVILELIVK